VAFVFGMAVTKRSSLQPSSSHISLPASAKGNSPILPLLKLINVVLFLSLAPEETRKLPVQTYLSTQQNFLSYD
jgi:hypothetical protein